MSAFTSSYRTSLISALEWLDLEAVDRVIDVLRDARDSNRMIFVCGNGGSAATAGHFVAELLKAPGKRFRIMALGEGIPALTAYSNDWGYEIALDGQFLNLARPGDVLIAFSGSGNSENVVNAIQSANLMGCPTVAFTGRGGGLLGQLAHTQVRAPETHMGRIEDVHMAAMHMICYTFLEGM